MDRYEQENMPHDTEKRKSGQILTHQLLSSGMKEDEVQDLAEHQEDGWEYVDEE